MPSHHDLANLIWQIADPGGSYCLFSSPVTGSREGKIVLVQLRDQVDPETGERYTVKKYKSSKGTDGATWRHQKITLAPINPEFKAIELDERVEGQVVVVGELIQVLEFT